MIKSHYHIYKNKVCCHVYSDTGNKDELLEWAKTHNVPKNWLQKDRLLHFDLFGKMLVLCEANTTVVKHKEFREDYRRLKQQKEKSNVIS